MSETQMFLLAITGPLAVFAYGLHMVFKSRTQDPELGVIAFISLFMINPPN